MADRPRRGPRAGPHRSAAVDLHPVVLEDRSAQPAALSHPAGRSPRPVGDPAVRPGDGRHAEAGGAAVLRGLDRLRRLRRAPVAHGARGAPFGPGGRTGRAALRASRPGRSPVRPCSAQGCPNREADELLGKLGPARASPTSSWTRPGASPPSTSPSALPRPFPAPTPHPSSDPLKIAERGIR